MIDHNQVKLGRYYRVIHATIPDNSVGVVWKCTWKEDPSRTRGAIGDPPCAASGSVVFAPEGFSARTFYSTKSDRYEELTDEESLIYTIS